MIIPNHLHVPEAEKLGFCFGSFDSSFGDPSHNSVPGSDKGPLFSQSSEAIHEPVEEQPLRFVSFVYPYDLLSSATFRIPAPNF